ncbi:MAG: ADP-ribose pyrophosphatase [Candidatus Eremiobacteraeota bacterium]|jgi:ADP-ribose pyrophosphatase|nr:ADP-ribose pyrophosphatase [Candidatus Eremiobacteraeota bacterium]MEA2718993.1 ADP-ribose pyrophosphatase [Candidatus Eremiobacteraeota bacterium]
MEVVASRRVYDGKVVNLRVDTLRANDGKQHENEVVEHAEAVAVIVRPTAGEMLLVKQYRHPLGRDHWEVVAGGIEPGESPEDAAVRELREETGYIAHRVERLWSAFTAPGFCTELLHLCVVHGYDIGEREGFDAGEEDMELGIFSLDDLWAKMRANELTDSKTQIAVLWARSERS